MTGQKRCHLAVCTALPQRDLTKWMDGTCSLSSPINNDRRPCHQNAGSELCPAPEMQDGLDWRLREIHLHTLACQPHFISPAECSLTFMYCAMSEVLE